MLGFELLLSLVGEVWELLPTPCGETSPGCSVEANEPFRLAGTVRPSVQHIVLQTITALLTILELGSIPVFVEGNPVLP